MSLLHGFQDIGSPKMVERPNLPKSLIDDCGKQAKLSHKHPFQAKHKMGRKPSVTTATDILQAANDIIDMAAEGKIEIHEPPLPAHLRTASTKPLSKSDEQLLALHVQTWGSIDARNRLMTGVYRLARKIARDYGRNVPLDDLIIAAMDGAARAIEDFDPSRGIRFTTYAVYWMKAKVKRAELNWNREGSAPITGAKVQVDVEGRKFRQKSGLKSLSSPMADEGSDSEELGDTLPDDIDDPETIMARNQTNQRVREILHQICSELADERIQKIVDLRMLAHEPLTLKQLGALFKISRQRTEQLERKITKRLRLRMTELREVG